ncbi:MAG: nicotinate phosphoribosyltransferase [Burkholderiaceae bacterium]
MGHYSERALLVDLYELTMLQAYFSSGMNATAVFEFFVRKLPQERHFLIAAGLEQVISFLHTLRFEKEDLDWLRSSGQFDPAFIQSLQDFRFTGDVDALPEGTVFFADEPVLRITAPLREAQFVESRIINLLHYQIMVASKAVRSVLAARGKRLIDFGLRRAHGAEAGLLSARASYIAGFDGTATTIAAPLMGIPVFGTMAHSYIQAHESETESFANFVRSFPDNATLLIDTYDTEAAAGQVARLAAWLREEEAGHIKAVRLDSGDLAQLSRRVRTILDAGDCRDIGIFASGNLDEYAVRDLVEKGAPIDGFGIGTRMNTSSDAPYLDCAYKLVEYDGKPRRKLSTGKSYWPGCKQAYRRFDQDGMMAGDTLAMQDETLPGQALLQPVIRGSVRLAPSPSLDEIRASVRAQLAALPAYLKRLSPAMPYPVAISEALQDLSHRVDERQRSLANANHAHWEFDTE